MSIYINNNNSTNVSSTLYTTNNLITQNYTNTNISSINITNTNLVVTNSLKWSNRAYGFINGNSAQNIPNTTVQMLTTYWNGSPVTGGNMTFNNGIFTVPVTGIYIITSTVLFSPSNTGNERSVYIDVDGVNYNNRLLCNMVKAPNTSVLRMGFALSATTILNSGQAVSISVYQDTGAVLSMSNDYGYFSVCQL